MPPETVTGCKYANPAKLEGSGAGVVMVSAPTTSSVKLFCTVSEGTLLSVTLMVRFEVPTVVGIPPIAPLVFRINNEGREPDAIDQV